MMDRPHSSAVGKSRALDSLRRAINADRKFPSNVFGGNWSRSLFFDSDWMFGERFVVDVQALLAIEGGHVACVASLDATPGGGQSTFVIGKETTGPDFLSFLKGPVAGEGWQHNVGRFGCASDLGQWCIYCEKRSEIAVIAVRGDRAEKMQALAATRFKALPIRQAVSPPLSYGFSERALTPEWRAELVEQYQ